VLRLALAEGDRRQIGEISQHGGIFMSRINTNVSSQIAQRNLGQNNKTLNTTLERLSTGLRINRGKDDPAGLIASENLRAEKGALQSAIGNAERADQIANIAEGGLQELSNLLTDLRSLVTSTANNAGLSKEERDANQLQVDSILQTIDRISDATNFQGVKLLNGNLDFTTTNVDVSKIKDFRINAAKIPSGSPSLSVNTIVTKSAQRATLFLNFPSTALNTSGPNSSFVVEVAGANGAREFAFSSSTKLSAVVAGINQFTENTGVTASVTGTSIKLTSKEFGSDQSVGFRIVNTGGQTGTVFDARAASANLIASATSGAFANNFTRRDVGQDVFALVNGQAATGKGLTARLNTDVLDIELTLASGTAQTTASVGAFNITGGGAIFQLASRVDATGKVALGIQSVASNRLGNSTVGFLSSLGSGKSNAVTGLNLTEASRVVEESIKQVSSLRGRLGAFQKNVVGATIRNLGISLENSAAAESVIRDADFASETAGLTRSQILSQAASNSLGLANQQPQSALALLRQ
jgi:flagellin